MLDRNEICNYIKNNTTNFRTRSNKAVARMHEVVLKNSWVILNYSKGTIMAKADRTKMICIQNRWLIVSNIEQRNQRQNIVIFLIFVTTLALLKFIGSLQPMFQN